MKRFTALFIAFLIAFMPFQSAFSQTRGRLQTQVGSDPTVPAPSFRGGNVRGAPSGQQPSGGRTMMLPSGAASGAGMGMGVEGAGVGAMAGATMVSMGYQVHVLGEVMNPGTYRISASDRLSEVLQRAGGVNGNGSERNIELRRKGGTTKVDLLAFTLLGKLSENPYLTDNDVIYVPLSSKVIQVVGAVKRPEMYELKNERNLSEVVELAGGFNSATSTSEAIKVIRFENGEKTVKEVPIELREMNNFNILSGDVVVVPNLVTQGTKFDYNVASIPGDQVFYPSYEDRVFVLGGVAAPGAYPFSPYYTISQYVSLAGGITDRGTPRYKIVSIDGKTKRAKGDMRVNPGDTLMIKEHWMSPASWVGFVMGVASFGLSASATVIALTNR